MSAVLKNLLLFLGFPPMFGAPQGHCNADNTRTLSPGASCVSKAEGQILQAKIHGAIDTSL